MSTPSWAWSAFDVVALVVALLAVPATAVLAITDTVLTQVTRTRVNALLEVKPTSAPLRSLRLLVQRRDQALHPVLALELVFDVVIAGLVSLVAYRVGGGWLVAAAFVVGFPALFLVAVALPRAWALHNLDRAAGVAGRVGQLVSRVLPVRLLSRLALRISGRLFPLPQRGVEDPAGQSFMVVAGSPVETDRIDFEDQHLLASVIGFASTVVREVMVPRPDMVCLPVSLPLDDALMVVQSEGYSRYPVTGESIDDVVGVLYAKDIANAALRAATGTGVGGRPIPAGARRTQTVADLVRPARFVPEMKPVATLLREMQVEKLHLAVVVDEYGGTAGLVTMEDIIEELVGEIEDEFDEARPAIEHQADGSIRLAARLSLEEVNEELGLELPEGDWDTIGGLVFDHFGKIPLVGDAAQFGDHVLEVASMRGRRIDQLVLRQVPGEADSVGTDASRSGSLEGATTANHGEGEPKVAPADRHQVQA
ncbi:MAG: hemolysin family protein [Acidimicrobiales bacterium]